MNQNNLNKHESSGPRRKLLTPQEVAAIIHKSVSWLAQKRLQGGGPLYKKIGRHVFYPEEKLYEWIDQHPDRSSTSDENSDTNE